MVTPGCGLRYTTAVPIAFITRGLRPVLQVLTLTLAACQQQPPPGDEAPDLPAPADDNVVAPAPVVEVRPAAPAAAPAEAAREPLQLDIPADILEEGAETGFPEQPSRLPDLFAKKKKTGTSVSGELLFEEGEDAALDTMSGAKITIQIPVEE